MAQTERIYDNRYNPKVGCPEKFRTDESFWGGSKISKRQTREGDDEYGT